MTVTKVKKLAAGTNASVVVERCQVCDGPDLMPVLFVGYLPPVNGMPAIGTRPHEQPAYPAQLLLCKKCRLAQLGLVVDPAILFPPSYPYTSGTTKILRDNFAELAQEVASLFPLKANDLVVDVGSNDGTLLSNFKDKHRVHGIEPTNAGQLANERGITTLISFFNKKAAETVVAKQGRAQVVTATNVFAHMEDIHSILDAIVDMLAPNGLFISESHYFLALVETLQYDTIYHEHLRYYSLGSLQSLLEMHGLEVVHAKRIPTHGGSIRVYAARKGVHKPRETVKQILAQEKTGLTDEKLKQFKESVTRTKLGLHALLSGIRGKGERVFGIGAPSRASTLINYVGLDDGILDCVCEIKGSRKIGLYIPGTLIPVVDEAKLYEEQPAYALLLSWHIADELMPNLRKRGFKGKFIVPLPSPRVVE